MYLPKEKRAREFLKEIPQNSTLQTPKATKFLIFDQIAYFCRTTANHGFNHLLDSKEFLTFRVLWAIVITCFAVVVVVLISSSVGNLFKPTLTSEFLEYKLNSYPDGVRLPDIHICDASVFNATKLQGNYQDIRVFRNLNLPACIPIARNANIFKNNSPREEMGFDDEMATYLTLATSGNSFRPDFFHDTQQQDRKIYLKETLDNILVSSNLTLAEVISNAAIKCRDIVSYCTQLGKVYHTEECCSTFFVAEPYVSIFGSCISTHQTEIRQAYESRDAGFVVYVQPNLDVIHFNLNIIKPEYVLQKGLYYAVSSKSASIDVTLHTEGQFAALNSWVSVPITMSQVDNSELLGSALAPYTCVSTDDENQRLLLCPLYDHYSVANCVASNFQQHYNQNGNCSVVYFKHNESDRICYPQYITDHCHFFPGTPSEDDCPIECILETYHVAPSYATFNLELLKRNNIGLTRTDPVVLHFFYRSFHYQVRKNHPNTFLKWLGEVGGNLGLFLGASLISLLEILVFFIRCCVKTSHT